MAAYLDDCLKKRVIFFTGKGGVGKTSLAWATALACRRRNRRVLLASWSPFDTETQPMGADREGVEWVPLETLSAFKEYALHFMKFERVYDTVFENHVLQTFLKAAPGLSETVISGKIWSLYDRGEHDLIVVDLPSSGHAISFFQSPLGVRNMFSMGFVHKEAGRICEMFASESARVDLVALPEEMSMVETRQLYDKLDSLHGFHFGYLHVNQLSPAIAPAGEFPGEVGSVVARHLEKQALEREAVKLADNLPLQKVQIPLVPREFVKQTIQDLASRMETL